MKIALGLVAAAALTVTITAASAEDKVLAIVVKGLDNPFFEQINLGCQKANAELAGSCQLQPAWPPRDLLLQPALQHRVTVCDERAPYVVGYRGRQCISGRADSGTHAQEKEGD